MGDMSYRDTFQPGLASALEPKLQDALGHPLRREIVRALGDSKRPLSIAELVAQVGSVSAAEVSYHLQVLRRCEVVSGEGARLGGAGRHCSYGSLITGDADARSFLRATEQLDREQRRAAAQRSSRLLMMFRIPRPTRTLRLGLNRKPQGEAG